MHGVHFSKQFAQQVLDAIQTGKPIPVGPDGWTGNNMLTLTGILHATIFSQGPHKQQALGISAEAYNQMHAEHREAITETLAKDIQAGIEFVSMCTFKLLDGEYDRAFEPVVKVVVYEKENGKKSFIAVEGVKPA